MASVQEIMAALEGQKSPFVSLMEGVAGGFQTAQNKAPDTMKTMMEMQDRQRMADQDRQIRIAMEQQTQGQLNKIGSPNPITPAQKIYSVTYKPNDKGYLTPQFEVKDKEIIPKSYEKTTYVDEKGKPRLGRFDPNSGDTIRKPDDPLATQDLTVGHRDEQYLSKRLTAFGDALDPSRQKTGSFGMSKQVYDRAEGLESLANSYANGNDMNSRQIEELAIGLNGMLSRSNQAAQAQTKALVPNTVWGNTQKTIEWLSNRNKGAGQGDFVKVMLGSITREKDTAAAQIKRTQLSRITRYSDLERDSPDEFYNVMQSNGVDPEEYKAWKKGGFKQMSAVQKPEDAGTGGWTYVGVKK